MVKTGSWRADSVPMLTALTEEQDLVLSTHVYLATLNSSFRVSDILHELLSAHGTCELIQGYEHTHKTNKFIFLKVS